MNMYIYKGIPNFLDEELVFYGNPISLMNSACIYQPKEPYFNLQYKRS